MNIEVLAGSPPVRVKAKGRNNAGDLINLPPGTQVNWSSSDPAMVKTTPDAFNQTECQLDFLGPAGSCVVTAAVVLPDQRALTGTANVTITVDVLSVEVVII